MNVVTPQKIPFEGRFIPMEATCRNDHNNGGELSLSELEGISYVIIKQNVFMLRLLSVRCLSVRALVL